VFVDYLGNDPGGFVARANLHRAMDPLKIAVLEARIVRAEHKRGKSDKFACLSGARDFLDRFTKELRDLPANPWMQKELVTDLAAQMRAAVDCVPAVKHEACEGRGCRGCRGYGWTPRWAVETTNGKV
jgi:hypothetical protein